MNDSLNGCQSRGRPSAQFARESSPVIRPTKEIFFVYQDKRVFFLLLGENTVKTSENSSKQGLERLVIPRQLPFFCSTAAKMRFTFCVSLCCKEVGKTAGYGI